MLLSRHSFPCGHLKFVQLAREHVSIVLRLLVESALFGLMHTAAANDSPRPTA